MTSSSMALDFDDAYLDSRAVPDADCVEQHFFEGAEKLLEIWFDRDQPDARGLRVIPRAELEAMLEIAQCHILHSASNGVLDSYVLSESSMFVSDERIILKTCGTTRLLAAVDRILHLAQKYAKMEVVQNVYYSRKNFLRPDLQPVAHRSFDREIEFLDNYFEDGAAFCMGSLKQDRWYLYTKNAPQAPLPYADHTLEILMTDMPEEVLNSYTQESCIDGKDCTKKAGIDKIMPEGTLIHEELFEPCGYSMNGLIPNSDQYATIHVTPEPSFSYVSFETNQRSSCLYQQTLKVLNCFKPNKFIMNVFANEESHSGKETQRKLWEEHIPGYKRVSLQFLQLQNDNLVYAQFVKAKKPSLDSSLPSLSDDDETNSD